MKLIALTGLHGAGKDTVADALPARKLAFADVLYREAAEAWRVPQSELRCREGKELPHELLNMDTCAYDDFREWHFQKHGKGVKNWEEWAFTNYSPRQILQWWGDYRRAQDPDYFVKRARQELVDWDWATPDGTYVLTDCRFPNEAAMVRQLGGHIWQVVRSGHEPPRTGHASETTGDEFAPDVVILNAGTLDDLRATALKEWERVADGSN
jgi:hypothetical protein